MYSGVGGGGVIKSYGPNRCPGCGEPVMSGSFDYSGGGMIMHPCGCRITETPGRTIITLHAEPSPYRAQAHVGELMDAIQRYATPKPPPPPPRDVGAEIGKALDADVCTGCGLGWPPAGKDGLCQLCADLREMQQVADDKSLIPPKAVIRKMLAAVLLTYVGAIVIALALAGLIVASEWL
jgi:hypothetical protein